MPDRDNCYLPDEIATERAGAALAAAIMFAHVSCAEGAHVQEAGAIIYLEGDLGAGKTTFSRGLIRSLGHQGAVKSPTYTLVEPYEFFEFPLYHFDLYRLSDPEEVEFLGVEDYFQPPAVALIEWPMRGRGYLPAADIRFALHDQGDGRQLSWQADSEKGRRIAIKFSELLSEK